MSQYPPQMHAPPPPHGYGGGAAASDEPQVIKYKRNDKKPKLNGYDNWDKKMSAYDPKKMVVFPFLEEKKGSRATVAYGPDNEVMNVMLPPSFLPFGIKPGDNDKKIGECALSCDLGPMGVLYDETTGQFIFPEKDPHEAAPNRFAIQMFNWVKAISLAGEGPSLANSKLCKYKWGVRTSNKSLEGKSSVHYLVRAKLKHSKLTNERFRYDTEFRYMGSRMTLEQAIARSCGAVVIPRARVESICASESATTIQIIVHRMDFLVLGSKPGDFNRSIVVTIAEDDEYYGKYAKEFSGQASKKFIEDASEKDEDGEEDKENKPPVPVAVNVPVAQPAYEEVPALYFDNGQGDEYGAGQQYNGTYETDQVI